jgi:membrane associated rhomboid family serine protease
MFPFRDHNPSHRTPYVTIALIVINVAVYLMLFPYYSDDRAIFEVFQAWGLVPAYVSNGVSFSGFVTYAFLHGGFMHLAGNMLFLWVFGDNLEDQLGHVPFLLFYLAGGVFAALAEVTTNLGSFIPIVGASGAVAAVMGGYLLLFPKARVDVFFFFVIFFKIFPIPAWVVLGVWFAVQLLNGSSSVADPVAYWAHAGGFVAGFLMVLPFWLRSGGSGFWSRSQGHPPHPEATYRIRQSTIPTVRRRR